MNTCPPDPWSLQPEDPARGQGPGARGSGRGPSQGPGARGSGGADLRGLGAAPGPQPVDGLLQRPESRAAAPGKGLDFLREFIF